MSVLAVCTFPLAVALSLVPIASSPAGVLPAVEQPPIANARLERASAVAGLEGAVRAALSAQSGPAWIGWAVPKVAGEGQSCCWNDQGQGCGLEGQRAVAAPPREPRTVKLEGATHATVLLRVEKGVVGKVRAFSVDCPLDAGGLSLRWLTEVKPAESVALLQRLAAQADARGEAERDGDRRKGLIEPAVHALAVHAGGEAQAALEKLAAPGGAEKTRKSAIFWLANLRGRAGYQVVARLAREDPGDKLREHAVFALTQSQEPEATGAIVGVARGDRSPHVRGQALFWLAQKASREAAQAITAALERDPDTEVKKKAVFALSQLPGGEGVPMLVQVARTHGNPAVKKQAMFWLGQSRDPRALKFFEEVLSR
jgi:hypothetical protein